MDGQRSCTVGWCVTAPDALLLRLEFPGNAASPPARLGSLHMERSSPRSTSLAWQARRRGHAPPPTDPACAHTHTHVAPCACLPPGPRQELGRPPLSLTSLSAASCHAAARSCATLSPCSSLPSSGSSSSMTAVPYLQYRRAQLSGASFDGQPHSPGAQPHSPLAPLPPTTMQAPKHIPVHHRRPPRFLRGLLLLPPADALLEQKPVPSVAATNQRQATQPSSSHARQPAKDRQQGNKPQAALACTGRPLTMGEALRIAGALTCGSPSPAAASPRPWLHPAPPYSPHPPRPGRLPGTKGAAGHGGNASTRTAGQPGRRRQTGRLQRHRRHVHTQHTHNTHTNVLLDLAAEQQALEAVEGLAVWQLQAEREVVHRLLLTPQLHAGHASVVVPAPQARPAGHALRSGRRGRRRQSRAAKPRSSAGPAAAGGRGSAGL